MPRVRRSFERPPSDQVAALGALATSVISDALGRTGTLHARLRPIAAARFAGPALTVRLHPNDNLMCHIAVTLAERGDVLVIDADGYVESAVWGEMLSRAALARGIAAVIVDGAVRDREAIAELGLPVVAAAIVPRGTFKRHGGDVNLAVACGGVAVQPGDIVVGDADGVVIVPAARAAEVIAKATAAEQRETEWRREMAAGTPLSELLDIAAIADAAGIEWE